MFKFIKSSFHFNGNVNNCDYIWFHSKIMSNYIFFITVSNIFGFYLFVIKF